MLSILHATLALLPAAFAAPLEGNILARQESEASASLIALTTTTGQPETVTVTATASRTAAVHSGAAPASPIRVSGTSWSSRSPIPATSSAASAWSGSPVRPSSSAKSTAAPTPGPRNPCAIPEDVLEEYDYLNAQIALRYSPSPSEDDHDEEDGGDGRSGRKRHNKLANTLQCLHPGGGVVDPDAPSVGLYGGLGVQLVPCEDAYYRWSIKEDEAGVVVGNGYRTLWALNAEDSVEGANITIREVQSSSTNQSFGLTDSGKLRLAGNDEDTDLCVQASAGGVALASCSDNDKDEEQTFVILLLPRALPASRSPQPTTTTTRSTRYGTPVTTVTPPTATFNRQQEARQVQEEGTAAATQIGGQAATGGTATAGAISSAAVAVPSIARPSSSRSAAITSSRSGVAGVTATGSRASVSSAAATTSMAVVCQAGYYW